MKVPLVPHIMRKKGLKKSDEEDHSSIRVYVKGGLISILVIVFCSIHVSNKFKTLNEEELIQRNQPLGHVPKWVCQWGPRYHDECNELFAQRLPSPKKSSALEGNVGPMKQRWLFFGDSTMKRQFERSNLDEHLVGEPMIHLSGNSDPCWSSIQCEERSADRCDMAEVYGFKRAENWRKPLHFPNFEGPTHYGRENPNCSDCGGCATHFLHCSKNRMSNPNDMNECRKPKLSYGGYMKVEFAKDVELQTDFYETTQENTAMYLREHFNTPELVEEWGKPICVILTGFHDMILLRKTPHFNLETFVDNVKWYLNIMKPECSHFVWVTNTAPSDNPRNFPQTIQSVKEWNDGVRNMIEQNQDLQQMTTMIDVYASSLDFNNTDHIHLIAEWYGEVGSYFSTLISGRPIEDV